MNTHVSFVRLQAIQPANESAQDKGKVKEKLVQEDSEEVDESEIDEEERDHDKMGRIRQMGKLESNDRVNIMPNS